MRPQATFQVMLGQKAYLVNGGPTSVSWKSGPQAPAPEMQQPKARTTGTSACKSCLMRIPGLHVELQLLISWGHFVVAGESEQEK